jgi:hypothetical protein
MSLQRQFEKTDGFLTFATPQNKVLQTVQSQQVKSPSKGREALQTTRHTLLICTIAQIFLDSTDQKWIYAEYTMTALKY